MDWARETGDYSVLNELRKNGLAPARLPRQFGTFTIENGRFVAPAGSVDGQRQASVKVDEREDNRDQVINDDLIVTASACVGEGCQDGELFDSNTMILKENVVRLKFIDTSTAANDPTNDWAFTINDAFVGGAEKFSIEDITARTFPLTIEAGAPSNTLYADDNGLVGMGTSTPLADLHILDDDSPTLRLQQDTSSGFTNQIWDLRANDDAFSILDGTNGGREALKIRIGALDNLLVLDSDNNVGVGTGDPTSKLHVFDDAGAASILVEEENATTQDRLLLKLENNGGSVIRMEDSSDSHFWLLANTNDAFRLVGSDGARFIITDAGRVTMGTTATSTANFDLDAATGNLIIQGSLTEMSDRNAKQDIDPVDHRQVLDKVKDLEIAEWSYIDTPGVRHMGPMAQDFRAAFGLGLSDTGMATRDLSAVAVASIQALSEMMEQKDREFERAIEEKDAQIRELADDNRGLRQRLDRIEAMLSTSGQQ
jgi:hypothetical protein